MIQSGGFLCNVLGNLGKKVITDFAIPLARDNLPGLVSILASNVINKLKKKNKCKRSCQIRKRIYFIYFE